MERHYKVFEVFSKLNKIFATDGPSVCFRLEGNRVSPVVSTDMSDCTGSRNNRDFFPLGFCMLSLQMSTNPVAK